MKSRSARWLVVTMLAMMVTACRTPGGEEDEKEKLAWPQSGGPTWVKEGEELPVPKEPKKAPAEEEKVEAPEEATQAERRVSDWFVMGGPSFGPEVGVVAGIGKTFSHHDRFGDIAWEVEAGYQWLGGNTNARVKQVRAGLKHTFAPEKKSHLTARYGVLWFKTDGKVNNFESRDERGGYVGGYLGAGYEWDLTDQVTTGPDVKIFLLGGQGTFKAQWQVVWNLIVKF